MVFKVISFLLLLLCFKRIWHIFYLNCVWICSMHFLLWDHCCFEWQYSLNSAPCMGVLQCPQSSQKLSLRSLWDRSQGLPAMVVAIVEQDLYLIAKNCQNTLIAFKNINKEGKQWDKSVHWLCVHIWMLEPWPQIDWTVTWKYHCKHSSHSVSLKSVRL